MTTAKKNDSTFFFFFFFNHLQTFCLLRVISDVSEIGSDELKNMSGIDCINVQMFG